jgi:hypothetical protein
VGLYDPGGQPVVCGSSGGGTVPVIGGNPVLDPKQADESAATDATASGAWSAEVGAQQDGCGGNSGTYFYNNAGPVPYRLVLQAS